MLFRFSFIIYVFLFTMICFVHAQDTQISGTVVSPDSKPLPYASLLFLNLKNPALQKNAMADEQGHFFLKAVHGQYKLEVTAVGYRKRVLSLDLNSVNTLHLPPIVLDEDVQALQEVTIRGVKKAIDFQAGKTIVTPGASILLSQGNLMDVMRRIPGISLNEDGTILLNGQKGIKLLVNGRETNLSGTALLSLLKSTSAVAIETIDVLTSPSSEYDASGSAGVINIKIKRNAIQGFTLSSNLNFQQGNDSRGDLGLRSAFRKNGIGLGIDYSHFKGNKSKGGTLYRSSQHSGEAYTALQNLSLTNSDRTHNLKLQSDANLFGNVVLDGYMGAVFFQRITPGYSTTAFSSPYSSLDSLLNTNTQSDYDQTTVSIGLGAEYKSNKEMVLNLSTDYLSFSHEEQLRMNSSVVYPEEIIKDSQSGNMNDKIRMISGQANFSSPISSKITVKSGVKSTEVKINNDAIYKILSMAGEKIRFDYSNLYAYQENNNAFYTQLNGRFGHFSFTAGFRIEDTQIDGTYFDLSESSKDSTYNIRYTQLFPSVAFQYSLNDNTDISISYNRRINRPNYRDLSPFGYVLDEYIMIQGNTDLQAELNNNFEAVIIWKKNYRTSIFYNRTQDVIAQGFRERTNGGMLIIPENMALRTKFGIKLDAMNFVDLKWWQLSSSLSAFYTTNTWKEQKANKTSSLITPTFSINSSFLWNKLWAGEVIGYYNGRMTLGQMDLPMSWSVSAGIRRKIWAEKCSVHLYANDIFASLMERARFSGGTLKGASSVRYDETAVGISLNYFIKKGQTKGKSNDRIIDESKRINF